MTRTVRLLALSATAAVALSGCGGSPIRAGAAAVVGEQLTLVVSGALAMRLRDPGHDTAVARAVAQLVVAAA